MAVRASVQVRDEILAYLGESLRRRFMSAAYKSITPAEFLDLFVPESEWDFYQRLEPWFGSFSSEVAVGVPIDVSGETITYYVQVACRNGPFPLPISLRNGTSINHPAYDLLSDVVVQRVTLGDTIDSAVKTLRTALTTLTYRQMANLSTGFVALCKNVADANTSGPTNGWLMDNVKPVRASVPDLSALQLQGFADLDMVMASVAMIGAGVRETGGVIWLK